MHKIKEMLTKELETFERKSQISMNDLDKIHKLTDTIKNIDKIEMLDEGYSEDGYYMGEGKVYGTSYAGRRKRDSMGRYSRDDGRKGGGYSYRDKDDMLEHLNEMLEEAGGTKEREAIKRCIRELEE